MFGRSARLATLVLFAASANGCGWFWWTVDDYTEPTQEPSETVISPNAQTSAQVGPEEPLPSWSAFRRVTVDGRKIENGNLEQPAEAAGTSPKAP
jgi:hypothetical protein